MSADGSDDQHTGTQQNAADKNGTDSTNGTDDDRPKPFPHEGDARPTDEKSDDGAQSSANSESDSDGSDGSGENGKPEQTGDAEDVDFHYPDDEDGQEYVDRSVIDFDPADGLYTGTAVTGDSDIPDPDEVVKQENESDDDRDADKTDDTDEKTD